MIFQYPDSTHSPCKALKNLGKVTGNKNMNSFHVEFPQPGTHFSVGYFFHLKIGFWKKNSIKAMRNKEKQ